MFAGFSSRTEISATYQPYLLIHITGAARSAGGSYLSRVTVPYRLVNTLLPLFSPDHSPSGPASDAPRQAPQPPPDLGYLEEGEVRKFSPPESLDRAVGGEDPLARRPSGRWKEVEDFSQ